MKEIQMVRMQRPNLKKFFYHTSINFPPGEELPNEKMKQIGLDYLEANGFTQHQFIMFRHHDADHPHLHILVNRIGYDGSVLSDSNDFSRSEKVLRELEKKYNLTQVPFSVQARQRAVTKDELEMMKRTNTPSHKLQLQTIIQKVLQYNHRLTTQQFIKALHKHKINVLFNQASTGYVSGISYGYEGMIIKGAKLGNDFKWSSIKSKIDFDQERDRVAIQQVNAVTIAGHVRTRSNQSSSQKVGNPLHNIQDNSNDRNLSSRLDNHLLENLFHADQQPEMNIERALKLRKKKKRRKGLRH